MEIAYLILAHCDSKQLHNAIDELVLSGDTYVHVNNKVNIAPFQEELKCYSADSRFSFVKNRINISWGGFSILKATFNSLKQCLENKYYDRVVLLTGLDYPIKDSTYLKAFFDQNKDIEYVKSEIKTGKQPLLKHYAFFDNSFWFKFFRLVPGMSFFSFLAIKADYVEYKGEKRNIYGITPKWAITGNSARKILSFYSEENRVNQYFKSTYAPDDYYFATVIRFFVQEDKINNASIFFEENSSHKSVSVKILDESDFDSLRNSTSLFARKLDSSKSADLLRKLKILLNSSDKG